MNIEMLKLRHLRLLATLKAADVQATCGEDDQWMITMPAARHMGWISFDQLEPTNGEWVILRTKGGTVFEGRRIDGAHGVWDYEDREHRAFCCGDFSHWMTKP